MSQGDGDGHPPAPLDVVYVVRAGENNEELRYSLRSLVNLPHGRVWMAGYRPRWISPAVGWVPVVGRGNTRFEKAQANLAAACRYPEVSERFVMFNDDFFVLEPVERVPVWHRGPVGLLSEHYRELGSGSYLQVMYETARFLTDLGHDPVLSYELHVPMELEKEKVLEAIRLPREHGRRVPAGNIRTVYGNHWRIGGELGIDRKVIDDQIPGGSFISTSDEAFTSKPVGRVIRQTFPEPSLYER